MPEVVSTPVKQEQKGRFGASGFAELGSISAHRTAVKKLLRLYGISILIDKYSLG